MQIRGNWYGSSFIQVVFNRVATFDADNTLSSVPVTFVILFPNAVEIKMKQGTTRNDQNMVES